jgi:transcriptional regulator NrdR family protein
VAYVRFASVYRAFQDVNDFVEELQPMLGRTRAKKPKRIDSTGRNGPPD